MNTKNNKRRRMSREKIERVFIELLQTEEITRITVSEICKKAGVNRATFYTNYADIYALADAIREKLEAEVAGLYESEITNKYNSNDFLRLFSHIKDNRLFYQTYFKLGYDTEYRNVLYDINLAAEFFSDKHIEYHIEFFKAGFNAIVKKWLSGGCVETPEEMEEILKSEYRGRMR